MFGKFSRAIAIIAIFAATLIIAVTADAIPVQAAANAEPVEIAQSGPVTKAADLKRALQGKLLKEIMGIPFFGDRVMKPLMNALKAAPGGTSTKYGRYIEASTGKFTATFFNIGNYGGLPRYVIGLSYDGILGPPDTGVWKHIPGANLIRPVIFFRLGGAATPVVGGNELKDLPGVLGKRTLAATAVTRTLRLPAGALVVAEIEPRGGLGDALELLNIPKKDIFIMAGAGMDSFPPGGQKTGQQDVDPVVASWQSHNNFARADGQNDQDVIHFKKAKPSASGYIKLSFKGKWKNPMYMFNKDSYAQDSVIMITYTGDLGSWGSLKNVYGKDYVYGFDIPLLMGSGGSKLPKITFGLSVKDFTLKDALKTEVGMLGKVADPKFLKILAKVGKKAGTSDGNNMNDALGKHSKNVTNVVNSINDAIDKLPLDAVRIHNPKFQAYDPKTESYPPVETFNLFFSMSEGIMPDGSFGPKFVVNGELFLGDAKVARSETVVSLKEGVKSHTSMAGKVTIGSVLGSKLELSGRRELTILANKKVGLRFRQEADWNLLGISKGKMVLDYKGRSVKKFQVHYKMDPSGSCMPIVPLKIDTKINVSGPFDVPKQVFNLVKGAKFGKPTGFMKCANTVFKFTAAGAKAVGKGTVIAGKYVAEGANIVGGAAVDGAGYVAKYSGQGVSHVANFSKNVGNAAGTGTGDIAVKLGNTLKNFGNKVGCSLGFGGCSSRPPAAPRIASPFYCAPGFHYSLEYGRCWATGASMFAFTGLKTNKPLCLTAGPAAQFSPMTLSPCTGDLDQQIKVAKNGRLTFQRTMDGPVQTIHTASHQFGRDVQVVGGAPVSQHKFTYDPSGGRLFVKSRNQSLCLRPNNASARANQFGQMSRWAKTAGGAIDVGVSMDGAAWKLGADSHPALFVGGNKWQVVPNLSFTRLDGGLNSLWGIDKNKRVMKSEAGKTTHVGGGTGVDIGVGGPVGRTAVAVSTVQENKSLGYMVYKWDPKNPKWTSMNGRGIRVDIDGAGTTWLVQRNGHVLSHAGKGWKKLPNVPGGAADISAGHSGGVMVTARDANIYAWSGKKWIRFDGKAQNISVGPDGEPWVTSSAGAYAFNTAPQIKDWAGEKQPGPFDKSLALVASNIDLETCEEFPAAKTWSAFRPKETRDYAQEAGLKQSFVISWGGFAIHNNDPKTPNWMVKGKLGPQHGEWNNIAGQEFSAVFVNAKQFALYNHQSGYCMDNKSRALGNPTAQLVKCTFNGNQLWERKVFPNGHNQFKNVASTSCLGHLMPFGDQQGIEAHHQCTAGRSHDRWDVRNVGGQKPFSRKGEARKAWAAFGGGYAPLATTREGDIVTITGLLKGGEGNVLATVPKTMAPPKTLVFNLNNNGRSVRLDLGTNGQLFAHAGNKASVSLSGITYSLKPGKPLALKNKWKTTPHGYGPATATKSGNIVTVSGLISGGSYNSIMVTLPAGYRPPQELEFTGNNNTGQNLMRVYPNGDIRWIRGTKNEGWVSLAGITFAIAPTESLHLFNGWRNVGGVSAPATVTRQGKMVTVSGMTKTGKWGRFGLLPRGYRPAKKHVFRLNTDPHAMQINIFPDGSIQWMAGAKTGEMSLSGISFPTAEPAFGKKASLRNKSSQRCLHSSTTKPAAQFTQWDCDPTNPNLQFSVLHRGGEWFSLINNTSNGCLTVANASKTRGAPVVQFPCHKGLEQYWKKVPHAGGWFTLQNRNSGLCLNLANGNPVNGAPYDQYPCDGSNPTMLFGPLNPASAALFPK